MNDDIDEQSEDVRKRGGSGGATIVQDKRVSGVISWLWITLGGFAVTGVYWMASSINGLTLSVQRIAIQNETFIDRLKANEAHDDQQDAHINQVDAHANSIDGRLYMLEGKTYRGVPGYGDPRHGR